MPREIEGKRYFSTQDVLDAAGVSRQTLWRWRRDGRIPCGHRRRDRQVVFTTTEFEEICRYANEMEPAVPSQAVASLEERAS